MSFLRIVGSKVLRQASRALVPLAQEVRPLHHAVVLNATDEELEKRFLDFFNRPDLDGWDVRQGMNDMAGLDAVPEPQLIIAVLNACRRVNDYAIAVRFLESVKDKCGGRVLEIYPWIIQEITPTLCDLGIDTPEELGYDKPELCLESVYDIH